MWLNGKDITGSAVVGASRVDYVPPLPLPRDNTVRVSGSDFAGNAVSKSWSFMVRKDEYGVRTLFVDPPGPFSRGTLTVTMSGPASGQAMFGICGVASAPMQEISVGKYVGYYRGKAGRPGVPRSNHRADRLPGGVQGQRDGHDSDLNRR